MQANPFPTERQRNSAKHFLFETVRFDGRDLSPLEAIVLYDDLKDGTASADHKRSVELWNAMWRAHKVVLKARGCAGCRGAQTREAA